MPAQTTYTHIATFNGTGTTNGVSFTNIPQIYTDLVVVAHGGNSTSGASSLIFVTFNGIYPNPLSHTQLVSNGSSASSSRITSTDKIPWNGTGSTIATSTAPGAYVAHIMNYTNTTTFKTVLCRSAEDQNGSGETALTVGVLRSTSAITAFNVSQVNGLNTPTTTIVSVYGIAAA